MKRWKETLLEIGTFNENPTIIGCFGGGMKELKETIRQIFEFGNNYKLLEWISREIQKTVLWESKSLIGKVLSGLLT